MHFIHTSFLAIMAVFVLSACVAPKTYTPQTDSNAVARERIQQEAMAKAARHNPAEISRAAAQVSPAILEARLKRVAFTIAPAVQTMCFDLNISNCNYSIHLENDNALNAYADGKRVVITTAMLTFTDNDEQLAHVIAHEMAHNMLGHVQAQQTNTTLGSIVGIAADMLATSQGFETGGQLGKLGATAGQLRYSKGFEREADYVGLYIVARAGYNPAGAAELWRRMSAADPNGIYAGSTHPSNPERYVAIQQIAEEIQAKKNTSQALIPSFQHS